jgi:hypothetical protein
MFGMLDYRAHKLYRLLSLPIVICGKLASLLAVVLGIVIAMQFAYGFLARFAIAYVSMEIIAGLFGLLYAFVMWIFSAIFFWMVDVIPARGTDEEEARTIVKQGRLVWLGHKLEREIQNWTPEDTRGFVSALNWRARLLFDARKRFEGRLARLQQHYHRTGLQPGEIPRAEVEQIVGDQPGWFEKAIVVQHFFNSVIGACIIAVTLANMK